MPTPSFFPASIARRGERWMRNPGGKELSREHWEGFLKGRRDRRPADKNRLKPACARESRQRRDLESEGIALPAEPRSPRKNWGWARAEKKPTPLLEKWGFYGLDFLSPLPADDIPLGVHLVAQDIQLFFRRRGSLDDLFRLQQRKAAIRLHLV